MSEPCTGKGKSAGDANPQNQSILTPETTPETVASQVNPSKLARTAIESSKSADVSRQRWTAEALYIYEDDAAQDPHTSVGAHLGGLKEYRTLYVIARIPELHNYPMPPALPHQTEYWKDEYWTQLNRFPTFVCKNQTSKIFEFPQPGDLIMVSFDDPELHTGPNYLGLALDKKGQLRSHWGMDIAEAKRVFEKDKEKPSFTKRRDKAIANGEINFDPKACEPSKLARPFKPRVPRIPAAKDGLYGQVCPLKLFSKKMADIYGPTGSRNDVAKDMVRIKFPFKIENKSKGFLWVHKKSELAWLMVFEDLKNDEDAKNYDYDVVGTWSWRCIGGKKRSGAPIGKKYKDKNKDSPTYGKTLEGAGCIETGTGEAKPYPSGMSLHSWGTAVDINPKRNPMRDEFISDLPDSVVAIFKRYGFRWGGEYKTPDPMHFGFCGDPDLLHRAYEIGVAMGAPQFKNYPVVIAGAIAEAAAESTAEAVDLDEGT